MALARPGAAGRGSLDAEEAEFVADSPRPERLVRRGEHLSLSRAHVHEIRRLAKAARTALVPFRRTLFLFLPQSSGDPRDRPAERGVPRRGGDEIAAPADPSGPLVIAAVGVVEGRLLKKVEAERPLTTDPCGKPAGQPLHGTRGYQARG